MSGVAPYVQNGEPVWPVCLPCWREVKDQEPFTQAPGWPEAVCHRCGRRTNHGVFSREPWEPTQ